MINCKIRVLFGCNCMEGPSTKGTVTKPQIEFVKEELQY